MARLAILFLFNLILLAFADTSMRAQQDTVLRETAAERTARLRWWREARFGMFIHWGPVSLKGTELSWSRGGNRHGIEGMGEIPVEEYDNLYKQFNPIRFNASEWVSIAQSAGMRYMVLTAKHHDGFCLWHTDAAGDYHIGRSPFKRDICAELSAAAHKAGMHIGWYYSPIDWHDPDCRTERNAEYLKRMRKQLHELLSNYGRIDLLWFDTDGGAVPWDQEKTYRLVRSLQPQLVINNRLDMKGVEESRVQSISLNADYMTPEQRTGVFDDQHPWETCMTLGTQWSWKPNDTIKSWEECVRILVRCVTTDGNLLLNVGPMPNGEIEPRQVEVLKNVGKWLEKYGESVYGTRGGPFLDGRWGGSTRKGNLIYLHVMKWDNNHFRLPPLDAKIIKSKVLAGGEIEVEQTTDGIFIRMPVDRQDKLNTIVKLEFDRSIEDVEPLEMRGPISVNVERNPVALRTPPSPKYPAKGVQSLFDGVRATTDHMDGRWVGFEEDDLEVVIDLQISRSISGVVVGCLQTQDSWIFFPKSIEVSVSENGIDFDAVGEANLGEPGQNAETRIEDLEVAFDRVQSRYVKIRATNVSTCPRWHKGADGKAWIFVDEIIVE